MSLIYALTVAGTGFFRTLTEAAMGNDFQKFLWIAMFSVAFLIFDSVFDFIPRFYRSKLLNTILHSIRKDLVQQYLQ